MAKKVAINPPPHPRVKVVVRRRGGKMLKKPIEKTVRAPRVRASLKPGTVLILLSGPYKGRRVVLLKPLTSGLLMVTGPFQVNRIPLRRVSQRFVIATSTKIDLGKIDLTKFDDPYFQRSKEEKQQKKKERRQRAKLGAGDNAESIFMADDNKEKKCLPDYKKKDQEVVDNLVMECIKKDAEPLLPAYLKARFTLGLNNYPHLMKF